MSEQQPGIFPRVEYVEVSGAAILELSVTATRDAIGAKARGPTAMYGTVDVVINNAGSAVLGTIEEIPMRSGLNSM